MSTKIFYNDNRIIIDGHADTAEECQAITAMCDEMANSDNFKTIAYEKGHAVFERVSGGDAMMFAMMDYVLTSKYNGEVGENYPTPKGTIARRLDTLEDFTVQLASVLANVLGYNIYSGEQTEGIVTALSRLDALESKTTKTLPYTADELIAKLESINP